MKHEELMKKLYGDAEQNPDLSDVYEMAEGTTIGQDLLPVDLDVFKSGVNALGAAGYSNIRELNGDGFTVWYQTVRGLGDVLFKLTVQRLMTTGMDQFRTGRILLGDFIKVADGIYHEIVQELKNEHLDGTPEGSMRFFEATKNGVLPNMTPVDQLHSMSMRELVPRLSVADVNSLPAPRSAGEVTIGDYDPATHQADDLF